MVSMIRTLIDKNNAYAAEGHVLFDVKSWKNAAGEAEYGKLSRRPLDEMIADGSDGGEGADDADSADGDDFAADGPLGAGDRLLGTASFHANQQQRRQKNNA